jgi:hypothetical protein
MEPHQIELLLEIAIESAIYALIFFSVVALGLGMVLLIAPQKVERLREIFDQWLTPRKPLKSLEIPRQSDPVLYRNHRWIGAIAIILPLITLYLLLYSVAEQLPRTAVSRQQYYLFWQWLFDSTILFLYISNIFAFFVGIAIFFRPSLLKRVEGVANHWLSTRRVLRRFDQSYSQLDELILKRSRWSGIFLIFGSLYVLGLILTFMLQHPDWLDLLVTHLYKV